MHVFFPIISFCSSILEEIPWTEATGGLQSMEWEGVGHNLMTKQQYVCIYP